MGANSLTLSLFQIPFQQIAKVGFKKETGYPHCCCAPRGLSTVLIHKQGAVFTQRIIGLQDAPAFCKAVLAMKQATATPVPAVATTLPPEVEMSADPALEKGPGY